MNNSNSSINIHQEVAKRNIASVYTFIQEGNDLNCIDDNGNSSLHIAAANGYEDIVELLLDYEVDHDASNLFGWTPIMQAVRNGHKKITEMLVESGADVNKTNNYGISLLALASASGNAEIFNYLYSEVMSCEDDTKESKESVDSPMAVASLFGNYNIVKYLLDSNVDANALSFKNGVSPLMCAAAGGDFSTVNLLLNQGADSSLKNCGNYSALDFATTHNNEEIIALLQHKKNRHPIFEAIVNGNEIKVKEMLEMDPRLVQEVDGLVPLLVATEQNRIPVAKLLLHYGADVNDQEGSYGWTPIMYAVYNENIEMIKLLLNSEADLVNVKSFSGKSAFDIAKGNKSLKPLQLLSNYQKKFGSSERYVAPSPRLDFVHRQALKFKEFKRKIFKKNSCSSTSTDPSKETYRRNSASFIPQSTFRVKTDIDKGYQYSSLENVSATLTNTPKSKFTRTILDGNAKDRTFTSKCNWNLINKKRHSLPVVSDLHKNNYQQGQKMAELITESFSSPNIVGRLKPETEYDDIAIIQKRIAEKCERDEHLSTPSYCECACMRGSLEGQGSIRYLNKMCSPSVVNRQGSEYDSMESILAKIKLRENNLGYNEEHDSNKDSYIPLNEGYWVRLDEEMPYCLQYTNHFTHPQDM